MELAGLVLRTWTWRLDALAALPHVERAGDIHCAARWLMPGTWCDDVSLRAREVTPDQLDFVRRCLA